MEIVYSITVNVRGFNRPIFVLDLFEGNFICNASIMNSYCYLFRLCNSIITQISLSSPPTRMAEIE